MADERLRRLERAAAGGEPEAVARLLGARLRAGELDPARLDLLLHLGDPAARLAAGGGPAGEEPDPQPWVKELRRWGKEPCVRAACAITGAALPLEEAAHPEDGRRRRALEAAGAWLACPCDDHRRAAKGQATRTPDGAASWTAEAAGARSEAWAHFASYAAREALIVLGARGVREAVRAAVGRWAARPE